MTKERKLGFANCVSHPLSDSWVIPCSWQFSFISETLSSEFWKIYWRLSWFYSGFNPASLSNHQYKFLFLNHCHTLLLIIALASVSSLLRVLLLSSTPGSSQELLPGFLDRLQSYFPPSILHLKLRSQFLKCSPQSGLRSQPSTPTLCSPEKPHGDKVLFAFAAQLSLPPLSKWVLLSSPLSLANAVPTSLPVLSIWCLLPHLANSAQPAGRLA